MFHKSRLSYNGVVVVVGCPPIDEGVALRGPVAAAAIPLSWFVDLGTMLDSPTAAAAAVPSHVCW